MKTYPTNEMHTGTDCLYDEEEELTPTPSFLGLGSIVYVKQGSKRLMITGRVLQNMNSGEVYDYGAVLYPEGMQAPDSTFLFNHQDIREIIHYGPIDEEEERFNIYLQEQSGRPAYARA